MEPILNSLPHGRFKGVGWAGWRWEVSWEALSVSVRTGETGLLMGWREGQERRTQPRALNPPRSVSTALIVHPGGSELYISNFFMTICLIALP